jgi:hypothetical protein
MSVREESWPGAGSLTCTRGADRLGMFLVEARRPLVAGLELSEQVRRPGEKGKYAGGSAEIVAITAIGAVGE